MTVWRVAKRKPRGDVLDLDMESGQDRGWERVLDMDLNVNTNLVTSAISDDGRWVAVSDWYETKLFQLSEEVSGRITCIFSSLFLTNPTEERRPQA